MDNPYLVTFLNHTTTFEWVTCGPEKMVPKKVHVEKGLEYMLKI